VVTSADEARALATAEAGDWSVETVKTDDEAIAALPPAPQPVTDVYAPLVEKLKRAHTPELAEGFKVAILNYSEHFNLEAEYASHYDREVVEAKRDRYIQTLKEETQVAPPLIHPVTLCVDAIVSKGQMIDMLRATEGHIAEQQLKARLHERRLAGEMISPEEELDYSPHERDDAHLDVDYGDVMIGRYIWQLFPHLEGDADALIKDRRFENLPQYPNPLFRISHQYEKELPLHRKAEREIWESLSAYYAVQQKIEDAEKSKVWPALAGISA